MGFKRGQRSQKNDTSLLNVQGVKDRGSATWYHGKRVQFIYKAKNAKTGLNYKCIWGKVTASHGQSGLVRAKFTKNLPPRAVGTAVRVMLYPNKQI